MIRPTPLWRSVAFTLAFYGFTGIACLVLGLVLLTTRRATFAVATWYVHTAHWLERKLLRLDFRVIGAKPPQGSAIYAFKHESSFETLKLWHLLSDPAIVFKVELLRLPIFGGFLTKLGMIPVVRGAGAKAMAPMLAAGRKVIAAGRPIAMFPQGTRVPIGERRPYKRGIGRLYEELQVPVVPVALDSGRFWPKYGRKYGGTVTFEFLEPIQPGLPADEMMQLLETRLEAACDRLAAQALADREA
ncbi:MAG: plsC [Rhodospirillales bacterium]|nr:plsC [Rhodospirillales bacterium]